MTWLAVGVVYTLAYLATGVFLSGHHVALIWFRAVALLVPPLVAISVIARSRHRWSGCQWLFWATIALGLMTSAIAHVGWTLDEFLLGRETTWLGWHAVFVLFGGVAPLLALLAQPHRGPREAVSATTAVDIASIAVVTGFLYSYFVTAEDPLLRAPGPSLALLVLSELQQFLVFAGMTIAAILARHSVWGPTYRRLAVGLLVSFVTLTLSNAGIWEGAYRSGFVYDVMWILPFAFYPWAAGALPSSSEPASAGVEPATTPSRPWVIFAALALIPIVDSALRRALPANDLGTFRDLSTAVTVVSVLPLLLARLAVERAETRRADTNLRLLAAAIEQAEELILIFAANGRFLHANDACCRALGYNRPELATLCLRDLLASESLEQAAELEMTTRSGSVWRGILERRRKDGSTFPTSGIVVPLADERGRITHLVSVERDVTEDLLRREQLIHTERLSAVGQLVSGVAHELNNPLQSIVGFTELLIGAQRGHETRHDLEIVRAEAARAAKIVRNLLAFVRRSGGGRTIEALNDIVRATVALRAYELQSADIVLEEWYADDLPPVRVNREEIQQIVLNLMLNAEQAIRQACRSGRLAVRTGQSAAGVVVEMADDGPGIPPDVAGKIFEPFFSTKDVGEGTGLGLSIALGIAQAHGGSLVLLRAEQGALFRLTLPPADASTGTGRASRAVAVGSGQPSELAPQP